MEANFKAPILQGKKMKHKISVIKGDGIAARPADIIEYPVYGACFQCQLRRPGHIDGFIEGDGDRYDCARSIGGICRAGADIRYHRATIVQRI